MVSRGTALVLLGHCLGARLYLDLKFIRLTRAPPSPSTRAIAPIGGVPSVNLGGGGALGGLPSAHQWASAGLCYVLGLSLVLPYAYPCAWHCVAPVRSTWH